MKKFFLLSLFSFLFLCSNQVLASHYMGSEITYTCLGGNQYEVNLKVYVDCNNGGMGTVAVLDAHSSCMANFNIFLNQTTALPQDVTPICPTTQTSCNGGTGTYGIKLYEYSGVVTFAPCVDWVIDYTSCCRGTAPTNLVNPNTFDHYVFTRLDNVNQPCNNGVQFQTPPVFNACIGDTLYQSANAFDADGDSLVYSLTSCLDHSTTTQVTYAAGFSATNPFSGSTSIDAETGMITIVPTGTEYGYMCILVEEFRNGAKINETMRDCLIKTQSCTNSLPKVQQINGGNIAANSQFTASVGVPLSIDFYIYDAEVQAGTQTLTAALQSNFPNATTSFNAATSTFTVVWTPTSTDIGKRGLTINIQDNNCPYLGKSQFTVDIEVVAVPFVTAVDDAFFGYENMPITGNILTNDLSSSGNSNLIVTTTPVLNPSIGTMAIDSTGAFVYVANFNFTGLDSFSYQICDANGLCDIGMVYLNVQPQPTVIANDDNFTAIINQQFIGNVLTNDNTNTPITATLLTLPNGVVAFDPNGAFAYSAPTSLVNTTDSFTYSICNANGLFCDTATVTISVLPTTINVTDTIVLGENYPNYYCLSDSAYYISDTSNNAVFNFISNACFSLYGDNLGTDTTILASSNQIINFQITVVNGVWPGDTDDDALVNNTDLLNIGIAYNTVGVPRNPQSIIWNGYLANDWNTTFANGLDYKYADTDGNGTVNADDTLAIIQNWGLTYNKNGGALGAPIYLETDSMTIMNDSTASIPIMLGTSQIPVANIHGLAFTISYNWELVKDSTIKASFNPTWFGTNNQNMISIQKDFYSDELLEVAITRIDGNNIGGFGQIGKLDFTIQDDIIRGGDSIFHFNIFNIHAITNDETVVDIQGLNRQTHWQDILDIANNTNQIDLSNHINIYPNPASDYLNIETKGVQIETVEIYDLTGRNVAQNQNWNNTNRLNISELSQGMYIIHVKTNLGVWNEKVMILK